MVWIPNRGSVKDPNISILDPDLNCTVVKRDQFNSRWWQRWRPVRSAQKDISITYRTQIMKLFNSLSHTEMQDNMKILSVRSIYSWYSLFSWQFSPVYIYSALYTFKHYCMAFHQYRAYYPSQFYMLREMDSPLTCLQ